MGQSSNTTSEDLAGAHREAERRLVTEALGREHGRLESEKEFVKRIRAGQREARLVEAAEAEARLRRVLRQIRRRKPAGTARDAMPGSETPNKGIS